MAAHCWSRRAPCWSTPPTWSVSWPPAATHRRGTAAAGAGRQYHHRQLPAAATHRRTAAPGAAGRGRPAHRQQCRRGRCRAAPGRGRRPDRRPVPRARPAGDRLAAGPAGDRGCRRCPRRLVAGRTAPRTLAAARARLRHPRSRRTGAAAAPAWLRPDPAAGQHRSNQAGRHRRPRPGLSFASRAGRAIGPRPPARARNPAAGPAAHAVAGTASRQAVAAGVAGAAGDVE